MTATLPKPPTGTARRTVLDGAGVPLSALLALPGDGPPRATVVALHGGGMSAGYFDGPAHPDVSLLGLGARLGFAVLAVDRPGYGGSAGTLPWGHSLAEQSRILRAALDGFAEDQGADLGGGILLLGHSYGGMLALTAAADGAGGGHLIGVDVSGCGRELAGDPGRAENPRSRTTRHWGPPRCYPPDTFRSSGRLVAPVPEREQGDAAAWADAFADIAARISTPVRLTFAAHEGWWRHDDEALADLTARFTAAPRVVVDRQPGSGHNISLSWAARAYHLRALAFAEDCLRVADHGPRPAPLPARPPVSAAPALPAQPSGRGTT
ncbi:alpha/beta hydrolase family protein [Streptacidiphilus anmyonensis]|uniref:alpha/beta hydrolase family protein n=1 Tax=Streptacidiphilus anmyonensis TaxID=405782 RepID=UPI0005AB3604|nr:alpha/beta fold hydrolase [Streptacidiphilus anmyonensis]